MEMFVFWFRDVLQQLDVLARYTSKHSLQSLYDMPFVHISSITQNSWGTCNSTTLLRTPLLLRMLPFCRKQQAVTAYKLYCPLHTSLSLCFVHKYTYKYMTTDLKVPTTALHTKQPPYYNWVHSFFKYKNEDNKFTSLS